MFYVVIMKYFWFQSKKFLIYDEMEHGILNGLRIKVVGDIGRKGRKRREPVDAVDWLSDLEPFLPIWDNK